MIYRVVTVMMLLRSKIVWISLGVSLACHATLVLTLGLNYLNPKEWPSYDHLPVRLLMVDGEDVSVTPMNRDSFSVPAPPSSPDTSLNDEKAKKERKPPRVAESHEKTPKSQEPAQRPKPKLTEPQETNRKKAPAKSSPAAATAAGATRPVRVGMEGKDKGPRPEVVASPQPRTPPRAYYEGRHGKAFVNVLVTERGRIARVTLGKSSGHSDLDAAALYHVRARFRFTPARVNGKPVEAWCHVYVEF